MGGVKVDLALADNIPDDGEQVGPGWLKATAGLSGKWAAGCCPGVSKRHVRGSSSPTHPTTDYGDDADAVADGVL